MLILLVRHARAGDPDSQRWPDDRLRPLTNPGREVHAQMSRALATLEAMPEAVLTSPWVRAVQTAELMVEEMELDLEPIRCEALAGELDIEAIGRQIASAGEVQSVALVGHEPWIGQLASALLTRVPDAVPIDFPKSGVMGLDVTEFAPGAATLRFFLRPRHVRDLARKKKN
jgi:phosphohistidine phosphatase